MTTITRLRSVSSSAVIQIPEPVDKDSVLYHVVGRMIQITLALYLLPALLVVLMVGGAGILVLKIGRILTDLFERSAG
jgi:hypothetical protein